MVDNLFKKRSTLLIVIVMLASSFVLTGEMIGQEFIEVPVAPAFVAARNKDGSVSYLKVKELEKIFRSASTKLLDFHHNERIDTIIVPEHAWLESFLDIAQQFFWELDMKWKQQNWDCDNFSMFLSSMVTIQLWRAGYTDVRCAIGWMIVNSKWKWAGTGNARGRHALMFALTSKGLIVIEPQNGQYIELNRYPNKQFIEMVFLL
jgi:hypothetical protein